MTIAMHAAKRKLDIPTMVTTHIVVEEISNNGNIRVTKYTPATTIVAAWINALTGVGPSIASGNQT